MKNKKNKNSPNTEAQNDTLTQIRLLRQREKILDKKIQAEKNRTAVFKSRVKNASTLKAPKTLRTKAYYRFADKYPSTVAPDGFRENTEKDGKFTKKGLALLLTVCFIVFSVSAIAAFVAVEISNVPTDTKVAPPIINKEEALTGYHISVDDMLSKSAEQLAQDVKDANCLLAVFEFKSEYGYVYFPAETFMGGSADRVSNAVGDKVSYLSSLGIKCAAYISCFKDSVAASSLTGVQISSTDGVLFTDANGEAWLNPYSEEARNYVLSIITSAYSYDFEYILLDNICFPSSYSTLRPYYAENGKTQAEKNKVLVDFCNLITPEEQGITPVFIGDISAFTTISTVPDEKYAGSMLSSSIPAYCLDLRNKSQNLSQLNSSDIFNYVKEMPLAFILEAGTLARDTVTQEKQASLLFAVVDSSLEESAAYTHYSGLENIIIW